MSRGLVDMHTHFFPESWPDLEARFGTPDWPWLKHIGPDSALVMVGRHLERGAVCDLHVNVKRRPQRDDRRTQTKGVAGNDGHVDAVAHMGRQSRRGVVDEGRLPILLAVGQRHPALNAMDMLA